MVYMVKELKKFLMKKKVVNKMLVNNKKIDELINKQIFVRLTTEELIKLKKLCLENNNMSITKFVRNLIKNEINRKSDNNE